MKEGSMSARQLPEHPSLRHMRNEAKTLRRTVRESDNEVLALVRTHVRRLQNLSDDEVAVGITLQEIQHALACNYGFSEWAALVNTVEPHLTQIGLLGLMQLTDRDADDDDRRRQEQGHHQRERRQDPAKKAHLQGQITVVDEKPRAPTAGKIA